MHNIKTHDVSRHIDYISFDNLDLNDHFLKNQNNSLEYFPSFRLGHNGTSDRSMRPITEGKSHFLAYRWLLTV